MIPKSGYRFSDKTMLNRSYGDQSLQTHFWQPHLVSLVQSARRTRLHCGFSTALHLPAFADASVTANALRNTAAPNDTASNFRTIMISPIRCDSRMRAQV